MRSVYVLDLNKAEVLILILFLLDWHMQKF